MRFLLNVLFHALHIAIIVSSLFMCFFESLLVAHLWIQSSIIFSWLVLGPIHNQPGMCLITEIQKKINKHYNIDFPSSYMIYLYNKFGINVVDEKKINIVTFSVFAVCTIISIIRVLNI